MEPKQILKDFNSWLRGNKDWANPPHSAKEIGEATDSGITALTVLAWIDENPEAFTRIVVTKSWGRKVWWRAPNGNDYDTLRECVLSALPSNSLDHLENELLAK